MTDKELKVKFVAYFASFKKPIEKVLIKSETTHFVTLDNGRRESKADSFKAYFDTWKEAKDAVLNYYKSNVTKYQSRLDSAKAELKKFNDLVQKEIP